MASSEMGIAQSDQYGEVYEQFMKEYDMGKPVADITSDILEDSRAEFGNHSGILHGVWFALAKCQWMCGGVSEPVLAEVTRIIRSGDNLAFFRGLGASEQDLKLRKRNLDRFLAGLQLPRTSARKRKKPESAWVPQPKPHFVPLPDVSPGDLIAYPVGDRWRMFLVMDTHRNKNIGPTAFCFAWADVFDDIPGVQVLMKNRGIPLGQVPGDAFPDDFTVVDQIRLPVNLAAFVGYVFRMWESYIVKPTPQERFYKAFPQQLCLPLESVVERVQYLLNGGR